MRFGRDRGMREKKKLSGRKRAEKMRKRCRGEEEKYKENGRFTILKFFFF